MKPTSSPFITSTETTKKAARLEQDRLRKNHVCVVLLNWNGWADTVECLVSLQGLDYREWSVVVVDNGSTDDSVKRIRERFPGIEIIEAGENLGFAAGCNVGIRRAFERNAQFVWLLNNDTKVDRGALRALVDKADSDPKIGAVGSVIYFMDEPRCIQAWGGGFISFWLGRSRHFVLPVHDEEIDFITGASLLVPRQAFEAIGVLDEGFFLYWEDADFCFRLRGADWRLAVAGESKVWHKLSASVGKKSERLDIEFNKSGVRFLQKHSPIPFVSIWMATGLRIAKRVMRGDWTRARAVWDVVRQAKIES